MSTRRLATRIASGLRPAISRRQRQRVGARVVGETGGEPDPQRFLTADRATGEDEVLGDVGAHQRREQLGAAHVGHDSPPDLERAELRIGGHDADVGAERELEPPTDRYPVHRRDHRHRELGPHAHRARRIEP